MPGSVHSEPNRGLSIAEKRCLRSCSQVPLTVVGKNERWDVIEPLCFVGAG